MAITTQYVVTHKGVEKLITADKKAADQYDKMLSVADNLAEYILAKGIELDENTAEELSILMAKQKDQFSKLFKGSDASELLKEDAAEVVQLKANG